MSCQRARTRLLDPDELLRRLATSLDALGTGSVDMPQRQRTLRDTVQWSVGLLDDEERSLLETMAVFVDGWTIDAAGQVAGLAEDRALDLSEALERSSLIQLDSAESGPRPRMLNTIRRFVAERLAALAASQRLESLLPRISETYLHAVSQLAMAGISAVVGDFDGALRTESASLEELRGQDEPYWTTVAILTLGLVETATGRSEAALGHLREARALAGRFDHAGLSAWSQAQLGILALARGRPEEARALLDEGLELSLATHSTRNVTLCLTALAQLAFVQGEGERAALLAGAAEGLRQRVGLRAWPLQQQGEAQMVAQIRQALGADRFDQEFAAGVRLNRQQAVAAVRDPRSTGTAAS